MKPSTNQAIAVGAITLHRAVASDAVGKNRHDHGNVGADAPTGTTYLADVTEAVADVTEAVADVTEAVADVTEAVAHNTEVGADAPTGTTHLGDGVRHGSH